MKKLVLPMLAILLSSNAFADAITSSQKMQLGDSTRLYRALLALGHTAQPDPNDSSLMIHKSVFSSFDNAFAIRCENKVRGVDLGTECEVAVDSALSKSEISSVTIGAVGGVIVVNVGADQDVNALKRSVANPLGYFQSTETVQAKLPNGNVGTFPELRVDCKTNTAICQITLFP
jgi:hypothetical protein